MTRDGELVRPGRPRLGFTALLGLALLALAFDLGRRHGWTSADWSAVLAVTTPLATLALALIAIAQWLMMGRQAEAAEEQLAKMQASIDVAIDAASIAREAVDAARVANEHARESLMLDQRPLVVLDSATRRGEVGRAWIIELVLHNVGRGPAFNVRVTLRGIVIEEDSGSEASGDMHEIPGQMILGAGQVQPAVIALDTPQGPDFTRMMAGAIGFEIAGALAYRDQFRMNRESHFRVRYIPGLDRFSAGATGNEAD